MKNVLLSILLLAISFNGVSASTTATYAGAATGLLFGSGSVDSDATFLSVLPGADPPTFQDGWSTQLFLGIDTRRTFPVRFQVDVFGDISNYTYQSDFALPVRTGPSDTILVPVSNSVSIAAARIGIRLGPVFTFKDVLISPYVAASFAPSGATATQTFASSGTPDVVDLPADVSIDVDQVSVRPTIGLQGQYTIPLSWTLDLGLRAQYTAHLAHVVPSIQAPSHSIQFGVSLSYRGSEPDRIEETLQRDTVLLSSDFGSKNNVVETRGDTLRSIEGTERLESRMYTEQLFRTPDPKRVQSISVQAKMRPLQGWDTLNGSAVAMRRFVLENNKEYLDTVQGVALPLLEFVPVPLQSQAQRKLRIQNGEQQYQVPLVDGAQRFLWSPFLTIDNIDFVLSETTADGHERESKPGTIELRSTPHSYQFVEDYALVQSRTERSLKSGDLKTFGNILFEVVSNVQYYQRGYLQHLYLLKRR